MLVIHLSREGGFCSKWTSQRVRYPLHLPFPRCLTFLTPVPLLRVVWPSTRSSTARRNNLYHSFKPVLRVKSHNSLPRTLPLFLPYTCKIHVYLECFRSNFHLFSQETFKNSFDDNYNGCNSPNYLKKKIKFKLLSSISSFSSSFFLVDEKLINWCSWLDLKILLIFRNLT